MDRIADKSAHCMLVRGFTVYEFPLELVLVESSSPATATSPCRLLVLLKFLDLNLLTQLPEELADTAGCRQPKRAADNSLLEDILRPCTTEDLSDLFVLDKLRNNTRAELDNQENARFGDPKCAWDDLRSGLRRLRDGKLKGGGSRDEPLQWREDDNHGCRPQKAAVAIDAALNARRVPHAPLVWVTNAESGSAVDVLPPGSASDKAAHLQAMPEAAALSFFDHCVAQRNGALGACSRFPSRCLGRFCGLYGILPLLEGPIAVLIDNSSVTGNVLEKEVRKIESFKLVAASVHIPAYSRARKRIQRDNARYIAMLQTLFATMPHFHFSYEMDLTRTLQLQIELGSIALPCITTCDSRFVFNWTVLNQLMTGREGHPVRANSVDISCCKEDSMNLRQSKMSREGRGPLLETRDRRCGATGGMGDDASASMKAIDATLGADGGVLPWLLPVMQGGVELGRFLYGGRELQLGVIARRSRFHVGPRYFKRGINGQGRVANEIECEQFVSLKSQASCSARSFSSIVMIRGSIPLFWGHLDSVSLKPPVVMHNEQLDPHYVKTQLHFDDLMSRYGAPVVALSLIRLSPPSHPEAKLAEEYRKALQAAQQERMQRLKSEAPCASTAFPSPEAEPPTRDSRPPPLRALRTLQSGDDCAPTLIYDREEDDEPLDDTMPPGGIARRLTDCTLTTSPEMRPPGSSSERAPGAETGDGTDGWLRLVEVDWAHWEHADGFDKAIHGFFELAKDLVTAVGVEVAEADESGCWQPRFRHNGVVRVNCVDCLDRTNVGMLAVGQGALSHQLGAFFSPWASTSSALAEKVGVRKSDEKRDAAAHKMPPAISVPYDALQCLAQVWGRVGDAVALAYTGSHAMHRPELRQRLPGCCATDGTPPPREDSFVAEKRNNVSIAVRRYLHNVFNDLDRQRALDLLLGKFQPCRDLPNIWDVDVFPNRESLRLEAAVSLVRAGSSSVLGRRMSRQLSLATLNTKRNGTHAWLLCEGCP